MDIERVRLCDGTERLTIYRPRGVSGSIGTVLACPGGGYGTLADHERGMVAAWAMGLGFAAAVLEYRVGAGVATIRSGERHPPPLEDALEAVRAIRARRERWRLSGKVVVLGFSAGGHLAASLSVHGCHDEATRVDGTVLVYPVITMLDPHTHAGSRENLLGKQRTRDLEERFSCELQLSPQTPPAFIVHGCNDTAVPLENALLYAAALRRNRIPLELHVYPHGPHGFGLGGPERIPAGTPIADWPRLAAVWMRGVVG